jgi:uncharacterized protein GlcG (DUF336 family)
MFLHEAEEAIKASREKAREMDISIAIAVVDESGILAAFIRMDNSELVAVTLAEDKAFTALVNRLSTKELASQCNPGGPLYGLHSNLGGRMVIFPGGVPVWKNEKLIGAVGASGGTVEQDHTCAEVGAAAVASLASSKTTT